MFLQRTLVTLVLLPIGLACIYFGGVYYLAILAVFILAAAWEYVDMVRSGGFQPAAAIVMLGVAGLMVGRFVNNFDSMPWTLSLVVLAGMAFHMVEFERGRDSAAIDFSLTLTGVFYLGFIGAYLISVRSLPNGAWWTLIVLLSVMFTDSGAYLAGTRLGRHQLSPRLSPRKTWEGYWGGVVFGTLAGAALGWLFTLWSGPEAAVTPLRGAIVGLVLSLLTTLGDLGESMIKRQFGFKDSGKMLPGHGGAFDRIDSWLWAGVIGFYLISILWM